MTEDVAARGRGGAPRTPGDPLAAHDPRTIGPYTLVSRLGTGGMGTVYLGRGRSARLVAVKVIRPDLAADEEFRRRFRDEVAAARRVAPFCTAEVLDADPDAEAPYLVTEYIDGMRLDQAIARGGPLTPSTLTGLAVGVATALTAIHRAGLVHRDLKPSNVLLSLSGPRVIDFGIAQAVANGSKANPTSWGFGSAGWMAPEQINGQPIGPAADVFTWGILMAYAGTGRHPFGEGKDIDLAYRTVSAEPDLRGLVPPLSDLVAAALAKDPDARPAARDLLLALVERGPSGAPSEDLLGRAAERADVMARPAAARLTGPEPAAGPGQLPRTRVAPPEFHQPDYRQPGPGNAGYGVPQPAPPAGIVPPRRPSTPVGRWRGGGQGHHAAGGGAARDGHGRRGRLGLWLTAILIVLGAVAITVIALNPGNSREPGTASGGTPGSASPSPNSTGPGWQVYKNGSLEFHLQSVKCGVDKIGFGITKHPDGQYCLVKIDVRNVGSSSKLLLPNRQFLYDQDGGRHEAYGLSRLYFLTESLWNSISPGSQVNGTMVFDIPEDAEPDHLELHDSLLGDGVSVPL